MNRGLFTKTVREAAPLTLIFAIALGAFEALIAGVIHTLPVDMTRQWLKLEFVQKMLEGLLGAHVGMMTMGELFSALAWVHPVVLAIFWAHGITVCTRMPAGEIDRGTIDVLLGLPVSRWSLYGTSTVIALLSGLVITAVGLAGHFFGRMFNPEVAGIPLKTLSIVIVNLICMFIAVVGLSCLLSAACDRRGRAVAVVLAVLLTMFALDFLAQFWTLAERCSFLSLMHYYRPLVVVRQASWPMTDLLVLVLSGVVCWCFGGLAFARRDIKTV